MKLIINFVPGKDLSMKNESIIFLSNVFIFILFSIALPSFAQQPQITVNKIPIKIGSSTALEGPTQALGQGMKLGVETYFAKINATGGINGQNLSFIVYNDGYEPILAAPNMRKLIIKDQVLAVIGNVGTPTAVVTVPIANELKTLLYGCYSGAGILRKNPPDRYIINFRASYAEETASMVKGILASGIKPEEIAFFTQNDAFGDSGYYGAINALKAAGYKDADKLPNGRFTRNTLNVEEGLSEILDAKIKPKAIIMVGPYLPCAKFIKLAIPDLPNTYFINVSFVGSDALTKELGSVGNNQVIVTQVVPSYDSDLPGIKEYQESLKKYGNNAQPGFISLEGYLSTKLFVIGLQRAAKTNKLTREGIIDALESLHDVDIGIGVLISYDKNNHQALHTVWPTIYKNAKFVPFDWSKLRLSK